MALSDGLSSPSSGAPSIVKRKTLVDTALGVCVCRGKVLLLRLPPGNQWCPGCWDFLTTTATAGMGVEAALWRALSHRTATPAKLVRRTAPFVWSEDRYPIAWRLHPFVLELERPVDELGARYADLALVLPNQIRKFADVRYPYLTAAWRRVA